MGDNTTPERPEITGHDDYIIAQALWLGVKSIDRMPKEYRQVSNRDDMLRILTTRYPGHLRMEKQTDLFAVAMRNGFQPEDVDGMDEVIEFLSSMPDTEGTA